MFPLPLPSSLPLPSLSLPPDEYCLEAFTASGYQCVAPDMDSALIVGGVSTDTGKLEDLVQLFVDEELVRE